VDAFARAFGEEPLDVLVLNAGVMNVPALQLTKQGVELHVGVNHLGHFALERALERNLVAGARARGADAVSRVVVVSADAHLWLKKPFAVEDAFHPRAYNASAQYALSKLFNIWMAAELNRRWALASAPLVAFALHPGIIATSILRHLRGGSLVFPLLRALRFVSPSSRWGTKTPAEGARTTVFAATMPVTRAAVHADPVQYFADSARVSRTSRLAREEAGARQLFEYSEALLAKRRQSAKL